MTSALLSLLILSLAISLPLTGILVTIGRRLKTLDGEGSSGHVKTEIRHVPNIGGIAIAAGIVLPMLAIFAGMLGAPDLVARFFPSVESHLAGLRSELTTGLIFVGSIVVLHVIGLVDDRRPLGPGPKLLVMLGIGLVPPLFADTRLLEMLDPLVGTWASILVTTLWIALITNAMNFIDNRDGLCAGTCIIASAAFLFAAVMQEQWFVASCLTLLIGASTGFLAFNLPPAKIFMGDGGSLVLGYALAFLTVRTTYYDGTGGWYGVLMPVVVMAVPLYDFFSVTLIRLAQGKSPFVGDMQHLSHRLLALGLSQRAMLAVVYAMTGATAIAGIALQSLEGWRAALVGAQSLLLLVVLGLLEFGVRRGASR